MSAPFVVELPWPPSALSPNSREGRKEKATQTARYRATCWSIAKAEMNGRKVEHPEAQFRLDMDFRPPPRSKPDADNCVASAKASIDGVAEALGINDRQFHIGTVTIGEPKPWGAVILSISEHKGRHESGNATGACERAQSACSESGPISSDETTPGSRMPNRSDCGDAAVSQVASRETVAGHISREGS